MDKVSASCKVISSDSAHLTFPQIHNMLKLKLVNFRTSSHGIFSGHLISKTLDRGSCEIIWGKTNSQKQFGGSFRFNSVPPRSGRISSDGGRVGGWDYWHRHSSPVVATGLGSVLQKKTIGSLVHLPINLILIVTISIVIVIFHSVYHPDHV